MKAYTWEQRLKRKSDFVVHKIKNLVPHDVGKDLFEWSLAQTRCCLADRGLSSGNRRMREVYGYKDKRIIPRIVISVTNQCSLNCRDCNALMPYCKERHFESLDSIKCDMDRILSVCDLIVNVEVIGGEPFLYKDLSKLVDYLASQSKIMFLEITTNGTVPINEDNIRSLKNKKMIVKLSNYGEVNNNKCVQRIKELKENGIKCQNLNNQLWFNSGGLQRRKRSELGLQYEFFKCMARVECRVLYRGRFYVCGRTPVLDELGILKTNDSYLQIRNNTDLSWDSIKKYYGIKKAECCFYCDYANDNAEFIKSGRQVK